LDRFCDWSLEAFITGHGQSEIISSLEFRTRP
jgi:hypothetical protein